MSNLVEKNSTVENLAIVTKKLTFEVAITHSATAANKVRGSDLPGVCLIATEGNLTDVTGVEAVSGMTNYQAPNDASGLLIVMLKGSELGTVSKVQSIEVREKVSTGQSSPTVQALGTAQGLTAGANIAFEIDSATNFATTDAKFACEVTYVISHN